MKKQPELCNYDTLVSDVKRIMSENNLSPKEAAIKMGISATLLWQVFHGISVVTLDIYIRFCGFIGCSLYKHLAIDCRIFQAQEGEQQQEDQSIYSNKKKAS